MLTEMKCTNFLATMETTTKRSLLRNINDYIETIDGIKITKNVNEYIKKNIPANFFSYAGIYPYLFDFICYICTHFKTRIKKIGIPGLERYGFKCSGDEFLNGVLGRKGQSQKKEFLKELRELTTKNPNVYIYNKERGTTVYTPLITVTVTRKYKEPSPQYSNLKNIEKSIPNELLEVYIEFLALPWQDLFIGKEGTKWFPLFSRFHVSMKNAITLINRAINDPEKYPEISKDLFEYNRYHNSLAYRRLFLLLNLRNGNHGKTLSLDVTETVMHCCPTLLLDDRKGGNRHKDLALSLIFLIKGMRLFNFMAKKGDLLLFSKISRKSAVVPEVISYNEKERKVIIELNNEATIKNINPIFKNQISSHLLIRLKQKKRAVLSSKTL